MRCSQLTIKTYSFKSADSIHSTHSAPPGTYPLFMGTCLLVKRVASAVSVSPPKVYLHGKILLVLEIFQLLYPPLLELG